MTFTEAGGHIENQDAFEVRMHPSEPECWVGAIADGQGGQAGGAAAARLACGVVIGQTLSFPQETLQMVATWNNALNRADQKVAANVEAGFTTLIGFCVSQDRVLGASSGDSAVWLINEGAQFHDLTQNQRKNPPIGSGDAAVIPFAAKLKTPWLLLAMTDGVWKYVGLDRIRTAMLRLRGTELLEELQEAARLPRGAAFQDDFTAVIVSRDADPTQER